MVWRSAISAIGVREAIGWVNREKMKDGTPAQMKRRPIRPANLPEYSEKEERKLLAKWRRNFGPTAPK